jgi:hypothetical protein
MIRLKLIKEHTKSKKAQKFYANLMDFAKINTPLNIINLLSTPGISGLQFFIRLRNQSGFSVILYIRLFFSAHPEMGAQLGNTLEKHLF